MPHDEKLRAAIAYLGERWVLHPAHRPQPSLEDGHVWGRTTNVAETFARKRLQLQAAQLVQEERQARAAIPAADKVLHLERRARS